MIAAEENTSLSNKRFSDVLKSDLNYPAEFQQLFDGLEDAHNLSRILKNKDSLVQSKIDSCPQKLKGTFRVEDLAKKSLIHESEIGELTILTSFALEGPL